MVSKVFQDGIQQQKSLACWPAAQTQGSHDLLPGFTFINPTAVVQPAVHI